MKNIIYKGIEFDDFALYREANNSAECEYAYPTDENIDLKDWEEVNVYICPHCIKKYNLYEEAQTCKKIVEDIINNKHSDDEYFVRCGIKNCKNRNTFDSILSINKCTLKD